MRPRSIEPKMIGGIIGWRDLSHTQKESTIIIVIEDTRLKPRPLGMNRTDLGILRSIRRYTS